MDKLPRLRSSACPWPRYGTITASEASRSPLWAKPAGYLFSGCRLHTEAGEAWPHAKRPQHISPQRRWEGEMRTAPLVAVGSCLACALAAEARGLRLNVGATGGVQVLEQKTTAFSHGPLTSEVTLGRTVLGGLFVDLEGSRRHHLTAEVSLGPYHNDVERVCYYGESGGPCQLSPIIATSYAVHYGLQYSYVFGQAAVRPFLAAGIGGKRYTYDAAFAPQSGRGSVTYHGALGLEVAGRAPVRLEVRCIVVPNNPYLTQGVPTFLDNARQVELQVRMSVRVPLTR